MAAYQFLPSLPMGSPMYPVNQTQPNTGFRTNIASNPAAQPFLGGLPQYGTQVNPNPDYIQAMYPTSPAATSVPSSPDLQPSPAAMPVNPVQSTAALPQVTQDAAPNTLSIQQQFEAWKNSPNQVGTERALESWETEGANKGFLGNFMQSETGQFLGSDLFKNTVSAASGLAQTWMGMNQLGLSKDMFNFQKDAFNQQYSDQMRMVNEDRAARKATLESWNK